MNKRIYNIKWLGLLLCLTIFRVQAQENVLELDDASTPCGLYVARDRVVMQPGYSTTASGYTGSCNTNIVRIDEDIIEPSSIDNYSQTQFDPTSISINTNLPVQNNEGSAAVGKDGSANYTVNIALPPGINDLVPSLSIAYNSNSGSGFFGLGWNLTGLSAVTRIPKNMYENGEMTAINLNGNDLYALDGNRLVALTGNYGADATIYSTKIEQNNRIISHGTSASGPDWFEVQTPTGSIIKYGENTDARQYPVGNSSAVLTWYISQIEDINGNYINFKYRSYQGETILDYIEYTGNTTANVNPMNKIKFYYVEKIDKSFSYVGGYKLVSNVLCDKIRIFNNDQCVNEYSFVYYFDNDNYKSKLIEIKYKVNDVTEINSTKIIWNENSTNSFETTSSYSFPNLEDYKKCVGDFDGDGKDELLILLGNRTFDDVWYFTSTTWEMYKLNQSGWYEAFSGSLSGLVSITTNPMRALDIDGDGIDELIFDNFIDINICQVISYKFNGNNVTGPNYILNVTEADVSDLDLFLIVLGGSITNTYLNYAPTFSDIDADGINDVVVIKATENGLDVNTHLSSFNTDMPLSLDADKVLLGDYDGDGQTEIWAIYQTKIDVYECNHTLFYKKYTLSYIWQEHSYLGDFNGDGKTDIAHPNGGSDWRIFYSTGNTSIGFGGFNIVVAPFSFPNSYPCTVMDFNKDGTSDISYCTSGNLKMILLNKDNTSQINEYLYNQNSTISYRQFGDFNGDGYIDFVQGNNNILGIEYRKMDNSLYAKSIYDGFGSNVEFKYKPITDNSVYTKGIALNTNVISIQNPYYIVSDFYKYANNNIVFSKFYKYTRLFFHYRSRNLLGFSEIREYNSVDHSYLFSKCDIPNLRNRLGYVATSYYTFVLPVLTENGLYQGNNAIGYSYNILSQTTYDTYIVNNFFTSYIPSATNYIEQIYPSLSTSRNFVENIGKKSEYFIDGFPDDIPDFGNYLRTEISTVSTYSNTSCSGNALSKTVVVNGYNNAPFCSWYATQLAKTTSLTTSPSDAQKAAYKRTKTFEYYTSATNGAKPGFIKKQILDPDYVDLSVITEYATYDAFGHPSYMKQYDANSNLDVIETHVQFDNNGQFVIQKRNPLNQITTFEYNAVGQLLKSKDINGLYTIYEYDNLNHLEKTLNPDGTFIKTEYEWESNEPGALFKKTITSSGNPPSIEYFDCLSRSIKTQGYDINNEAVYTKVAYNTKGQIQSKTLPFKQGTPLNITYTYDEMGRNTVTNMPDGSSMENIYDEKMLTKVVTKNGHSQQQITKYNALGQVIQSIDNQGINVYNEYDNAGLAVKTWVKSGTSQPTSSDPVTEFTYDLHGNKTQLKDLDAGTINYTYDAYDRQTSKTDANSIITTYTYDKTGRMLTQTNTDGISTWIYDTKPFGKGLLSKVTYNATSQEYWYDNLSRLTKTVETVDSKTFEETYTYDAYSRLEKQNYPDNFTIIHSYQNGQLKEVRNFATNEMIWQAQSQDVFGNYDKYLSGNNLLTEITRNSTNGQVTDIKAGTVQWWHYTYDDNQNIASRRDAISGQNEFFTYDANNRLINIDYNNDVNHTPLSLLTMDYDNRGNITTKSDAGDYVYEDPNKPNQLSKLTNYNPASTPEHFPKYYINGKTKKIEQGNQIIDFTYGADDMRVKTIQNDNGTILTKYFALGDYEEETDGTVATKYYYIMAGDGLAAIYKQISTAAGTMYYVHKDLLGSIDLLTTKVNNTAQVAERYAYDAWGNRRNPVDWTQPDLRTAWIIVRGYIGQEHLDIFGLINLNGRMYEPRTGRFLSADDFVSNPDFSQAFNRYAYCLNNPLIYTDPDGEWIQYVLGAIIGGINGWMIADGAGYKGWDKFWYTLGGAVIGAATGGIGTAVSSSVGIVVGGIAGGAISGLGYGTLNGYANGLRGGDLLNSALTGLWQGAVTGLLSSSVGGAIGGGWGAFAGGITAGAVGTALNGGSGEDIIKGAAFGGVMGWGVYHASLAYSYHASGIKGTELKYNEFARMMRLTQRSMFWNREGKFIPNSKGGVNFSKLGTRNSTPETSLDDYTDALFNYHTHQEFGYEEFSTAQQSFEAYGDSKYSDYVAMYSLNKIGIKIPMYLGTREGHILYMNTNFSQGAFTYNFSHVFTPFNIAWSLFLIR